MRRSHISQPSSLVALLTALLLIIGSIPATVFAVTETTLSPTCSGTNIRTGTSTSSTIKTTLGTTAKVVSIGTVSGGSWTTGCPSSKSGSTWYKLTKINGKTVSSLYGVSYLYAATGVMKVISVATPTPAPTASPTATPAPTASPTPTPTPAPTAAPTPTPAPTSAPTPTPAPTAAPTPTPKPWPGSFNVYRSGSFVTQADMTWCIGAASLMMRNIVKKESNTTVASQRNFINYARAHDTQPASSDGSDPRGWANALTHYGAGTYKDKSFTSLDAALKYAATRIRLTGKPVGLLVGSKGGNHAWVMTGFVSTKDPAATSSFSVTYVYVSGPLYPKQVAYKGLYDLKPNSKLSHASIAKAFLSYKQTQGSSTWKNKWVIVTP